MESKYFQLHASVDRFASYVTEVVRNQTPSLFSICLDDLLSYREHEQVAMGQIGWLSFTRDRSTLRETAFYPFGSSENYENNRFNLPPERACLTGKGIGDLVRFAVANSLNAHWKPWVHVSHEEAITNDARNQLKRLGIDYQTSYSVQEYFKILSSSVMSGIVQS